MEYVFDAEKSVETLRTKGTTHSDLTGFHELVREFPDQIITDKFRVVKKWKSGEDDEGNKYDWYFIDCHYRSTDKFTPARAGIESEIGENQTAIFDVADLADENSNGLLDLAEYVAELEERISELEG